MSATAKLFKNGRSQAVRLPKEFRLPGDEVYIERKGGKVILSPKPKVPGTWADFFARMKPVGEDFMADRPLNIPLRLQPVRPSVRKLLKK